MNERSGVNLGSWLVLAVLITCITDGSRATKETAYPRTPASVSCTVASTGIGVLDSLVTFSAKLKTSLRAAKNSSLYMYSWRHNVTGAAEKNVTNYSNETLDVLAITFPSYSVKAGNYSMKVSITLQDTDNQDPDTTCEDFFTLTDFINLNMTVHQPADRVPLPLGRYITHKNITSDVQITDNFPTAQYQYTWLLDRTVLGVSSKADYVFMVNKTGTYNFTMKLKATVTLNATTGDKIYKLGQGSTNVTLKDTVSNLSYTGPSSLQFGGILQGSISCQGSPPFDLCVNISHPSGELLYHCEHLSAVAPLCMMHLYVDNFTAVGTHSMNVTVYNEVSMVDRTFYVNITVPPVNAAVPVFCVIIAFVAIALILFSYKFDREHSVVETADFSFHNARSRSNSFSGGVEGFCFVTKLKILGFFGWAKESFMGMYSRVKDQPDERAYDSDDDMPSNTDSKERYGSLSEVPA